MIDNADRMVRGNERVRRRVGLPQEFGGVVPPVCTPLTESFEVDIESFERLIEFQIDAGVHGLFVLGSTSEMAFLTNTQRAQVLETAVSVARGRVPVVAGIIDMTTARCLEHAQAAAHAGADALVLTAPYYARASQAETIDHFRTIHAAVDLPILAYDVPPAVHTKLERDTVLRLAQEELIVGIKDSSGDDANFRGLLLETRGLPNFSAFTGSELLVDSALLMGASGTVPGLGNVDPAGYVRLFNVARAGDWAAARQEQERLYRLFSIVFAGTTGRMGFGSSAMGGFKTALMLRGVIATNVVGRPMTRFNDAEVDRVRAALVTAGLLPE